MSDNAQELAALEQRIAALEQGAGGQESPEGMRDRIQRERQERIEKKELDSFSRKSEERNASRPTGSHRKEDLSRRSQMSLAGPQLEAPRARAAQDAGKLGGDTIEIVVVDNGEFKTGNFYIDGELELVE